MTMMQIKMCLHQWENAYPIESLKEIEKNSEEQTIDMVYAKTNKKRETYEVEWLLTTTRLDAPDMGQSHK